MEQTVLVKNRNILYAVESKRYTHHNRNNMSKIQSEGKYKFEGKI
jgi:hypothetical protein